MFEKQKRKRILVVGIFAILALLILIPSRQMFVGALGTVTFNVVSESETILKGEGSGGSHMDTHTSDGVFRRLRTTMGGGHPPIRTAGGPPPGELLVTYQFSNPGDYPEADLKRLTVTGRARVTDRIALFEIYNWDSSYYERVDSFNTYLSTHSKTFSSNPGRFINSDGTMRLRWKLQSIEYYESLSIDMQRITLEYYEVLDFTVQPSSNSRVNYFEDLDADGQNELLCGNVYELLVLDNNHRAITDIDILNSEQFYLIGWVHDPTYNWKATALFVPRFEGFYSSGFENQQMEVEVTVNEIGGDKVISWNTKFDIMTFLSSLPEITHTTTDHILNSQITLGYGPSYYELRESYIHSGIIPQDTHVDPLSIASSSKIYQEFGPYYAIKFDSNGDGEIDKLYYKILWGIGDPEDATIPSFSIWPVFTTEEAMSVYAGTELVWYDGASFPGIGYQRSYIEDFEIKVEAEPLKQGSSTIMTKLINSGTYPQDFTTIIEPLVPVYTLGWTLDGYGFKMSTDGAWEVQFKYLTFGASPPQPLDSGPEPFNVYLQNDGLGLATCTRSPDFNLLAGTLNGYSARFNSNYRTDAQTPFASLITVTLSLTIITEWRMPESIGGSWPYTICHFETTTFTQSLQYIQCGCEGLSIGEGWLGLNSPYNPPTSYYWQSYYYW